MSAKNSVNGIGSGEGDVAGGAEVQPWTAGRKAAIVLDIDKANSPPADAARSHDLAVADVEAKFDPERKDLLAKVDELTLQVEALKEGTKSASAPMGASGQAARLEPTPSPPCGPRARPSLSARSAGGSACRVTTAPRVIARWIEWYNTRRPHSSLGYASPRQAAERHRQARAAA